jgi:hypothetical protein
MSTKYSSYLEGLAQRLSNNGFTVKRAMKVGPYQLDVVAVKSAWEFWKFGRMTRFVLASGLEAVDFKTVQDFSSRSTKFALDNRDPLPPRGLGGSLLSVPVIVSDDFDESLKAWIRKTLAAKHWAAFEFPVLISLKLRQLYYCMKTPNWGRAYYRGFRKFVEQQLSF